MMHFTTFLVFLSLTLNKQMLAGESLSKMIPAFDRSPCFTQPKPPVSFKAD